MCVKSACHDLLVLRECEEIAKNTSPCRLSTDSFILKIKGINLWANSFYGIVSVVEICGLCKHEMRGAKYALDNLWVHFECGERLSWDWARKRHLAERELENWKKRQKYNQQIKAQQVPK